jgi:hypothetical protein
VFFLGKRASHVAASKPGLDVRHWNAALSGGHRRCDASGGVALHDDEVGALQQVRVVQLTAQPTRHLGERARSHGLQVFIGPHTELFEELRWGVPMLTRINYVGMNVWLVAEFADKRRKLYGLGASADNTDEPHPISVLSQLCTVEK